LLIFFKISITFRKSTHQHLNMARRSNRFVVLCVLLLLHVLWSFFTNVQSFSNRDVQRLSLSQLQYEAVDLTPHLIFPGGGIYFYWQAGAVTFLREQNYDINATTITGASAGALSAALTATQVDFYQATELALQMAAEANVWNRGLGLQGIWGDMIYQWLDNLLPPDAVQQVNHTERLTLLVTPIPSFGKMKVNRFRDREDLLRCLMASVHLPWFLDSKFAATFRDLPCIDGSFLARDQDYHPYQPSRSRNTLVLDYRQDPRYQSQSLLSFIEAVNPSAIYDMLEDGKRYAKIMEEKGMFANLKKIAP
jgi:Patatin-like phospholipase